MDGVIRGLAWGSRVVGGPGSLSCGLLSDSLWEGGSVCGDDGLLPEGARARLPRREGARVYVKAGVRLPRGMSSQ